MINHHVAWFFLDTLGYAWLNYALSYSFSIGKKMFKKMVLIPLAMVILLISFMSATLAASEKKSNPQKVYSSPVGFWLVHSNNNGSPRSVIEIKLIDGKLQGYFDTILYVKGKPWASTCVGCRSPYTGKKLIGMHFMEGLSPKGKTIHWDTVWGPGTVFNADTNKIYSIKLQQVDQGRRLKMVGCLPNAGLFCRTSYWTRITSKKQLNSYRARGAKDLKTYPATHGG